MTTPTSYKLQAAPHRPAFTLTEVLVATSVIAIALSLIYSIVQVGHRTYLTGERRAELAQNARVIVDRVVREFRQTPELITALPDVPDDPFFLPPDELFFRNGHQLDPITYIRYWHNPADHTVNRQVVAYAFDNIDPSAYVLFSAINNSTVPPTPPDEHIINDEVIGEYVDSFTPWGDRTVTLDLTLRRVDTTLKLRTSVLGRNL
jgi:prepilin-type N-terminal cleavage/methylation domain-containing protein